MIERAVFFFLLLLLLTAPLILTTDVSIETAKWFLIRVGATTLLAVWLLLGAFTGRLRFHWDPLTVLALAFIGTQVLSVVGATNVWDGLEVVSKQVGLLAIFLLVANLPRSAADRNAVLWTVALVGAATSIYGIAQHFGYDFFPWQEHKEVPVSRGVSFFGHATFAGSALIMLIPLTIGLAAISKPLAGRIAASLIVILMLYHLSFSGARIATIGIFVSFLIVAGLELFHWLRARRRLDAQPVHMRRLMGTGLLVAVILVGGSILSVRAWDVKGSDLFGIRQSSLGLRFFAWETASRMFLENPVRGVGAGNYGVESPAYWNAIESAQYARHERRFYQAHNEYLEVAAEQGLPGIAVMLGLTAFALVTSYRLARHAPTGKERHIGLALFAAVVAISIDATVTFNQQIPGSALLYWTALGLISYGASTASAEQSESKAVS